MTYRLVTGTDREAFEAEVNALIADKWQPLGGVAIVPPSPQSLNITVGAAGPKLGAESTYAQALVKLGPRESRRALGSLASNRGPDWFRP